MNGQDLARAYLALCEEYGWTPSVKGLDAWFQIVEGGLAERWNKSYQPSASRPGLPS